MTVLRYSSGSLIADALRGLAGTLVTMAPPILVENILAPIAWILWGLSVIFVIYLIRTLLRYKTEVHMTPETLSRVSPLGQKTIAWDHLTEIKLSYFASARTRAGAGVTALTLKGKDSAGTDTKIVVESALNGFDMIVETAAALGSRPGVSVDPTSVYNFEAFGAPIREE